MEKNLLIENKELENLIYENQTLLENITKELNEGITFKILKKNNEVLEEVEKEIFEVSKNFKKNLLENQDIINQIFMENLKINKKLKDKELEYNKLLKKYYVLEKKYENLSESKLGKLTINYWKLKRGSRNDK